MKKEIKGFPGYYISDKGEVYSTRGIGNQHGLGKVKGKKMTKKYKFSDGGGYLQVFLRGPLGDKYARKIHRLVGEHFIPNPLNLPQLNHKDHDKNNNRKENLEWCSNSYNMKHSYANGRNKKRRPQELIDRVKGFRAEGLIYKEIGKRMGIPTSTIFQICNKVYKS